MSRVDRLLLALGCHGGSGKRIWGCVWLLSPRSVVCLFCIGYTEFYLGCVHNRDTLVYKRMWKLHRISTKGHVLKMKDDKKTVSSRGKSDRSVEICTKPVPVIARAVKSGGI